MKEEIGFIKLLVFVNALVPLALLSYDAYYHRLGANPLEFFTWTTGTLTLVFLIIALLVTPLRKILGLPWMIKLRRMTGLFAFFYGFLHLVAYVWFDKSFQLGAVTEDVVKRPFIAFGMLGFFLMIPLAVTSTQGWVKRLGGKNWNRLHKLAYLAPVAGVIHYYLKVKTDVRIPVWFGVALAVLLIYRLLNKYAPQLTQKQPARTQARPE
ncbi:MAG: protein-methionine-sulfoxide reductase heme-binding subunit MsrQ [Acidobacteriota bacterium]